MEYIVFISIILLLIALFFKIKPYNFQHKSSVVKKSEIIATYKEKLNSLETKQEKILYLKEINQELSRNIFFDQSETEDLIRDLSKDCV